MARRSRSESPTPTLAEDTGSDESSALKRGLEVLRLITPAEPGVSISRITEELNTTRPTAQRLVATLVEHGFLRTSRAPDRFFADLSTLTLGKAYLSSVDGLDNLVATLRTFQDVEKASVTVWIRERAEGVCLASSGLQELMVGGRFELDRFAVGHALMWSADSAVRIALLERFARASSSRAGSKPGLLYGSFHQLETEGYCISDATPGQTTQAIAFPFRSSTHAVALAFSIEPTRTGTSWSEARAKDLVRKLTDLASRTFSL